MQITGLSWVFCFVFQHSSSKIWALLLAVLGSAGLVSGAMVVNKIVVDSWIQTQTPNCWHGALFSLELVWREAMISIGLLAFGIVFTIYSAKADFGYLYLVSAGVLIGFADVAKATMITLRSSGWPSRYAEYRSE